MSNTLSAVRGMNDLLPPQTIYWRYLERQLKDLALTYGYKEIRFPILERTSLFKRSIGEATDIVEKEMYTFEDRNGDSLTLRPEGTAGCVRAGIEHGLLYNQIQRFWYLGPMFRHERPQKGRYRQFYQFGIEAFGIPGVGIEAEILLLTARLWKLLGLQDQVTLHLNSLGSPEARANYRAHLVEYFNGYASQLDEDSQRRLKTNPLRILDSKNPEMQSIIEQAPKLNEFLDDSSAQQFQQLCQYLDEAGIHYCINPRLVRGLDYYGGMVFEWITNHLGAQNAICSGGRYDALVELLGGKPTPAVGFAIGMERLISLLETRIRLAESPDIYVALLANTASGLILTEKWRDQLPQTHIQVSCEGGSLKNQLKRADKSGAHLAFIIGEEELKTESVTVKFLREERPQVTLPAETIPAFLASSKLPLSKKLGITSS